ncbi:MAG: MFS transporter [Propionicimonas sp.]|nr:MFS transporter [Propionicimonas sp.]
MEGLRTTGGVLRQAWTVAGAYAAQAFGYAAVVTSLPALRTSAGLDDTGLSLVLLGMTFAAASGSLLANLIAVRAGSRSALLLGLGAQATGLASAALSGAAAPLIASLVVMATGLGLVDAGANMQGSLTERRAGRPVFGRLYAAGTLAGILATLLTVVALSVGAAAMAVLLVASGVHLAAALAGWRGFDRQRAAHRVDDVPRARARLPYRAMVLVGLLVFAAFVIDTAVASWGTIYATDILGLPAALAPVGYACYLVAVFAARLATDPLVRRLGRLPVGIAATVTGLLGATLLTLGWPLPAALAGFGLAGLAFGALVPLAFGRAGELLPERSDEVIARVNMFNYAASVLGAVLPGIVAELTSLNWAYLLLAGSLAACLPALAVLRPPSPAAATAGQGGATAG